MRCCRIPVLNMLIDGSSAVTMFFVLSGFVLTHPFLTPGPDGTTSRPLYIPTFYMRRITRIWLPWFAAFALSALAKKLLFSPKATIPAISPWFHEFWRLPLSVSSVLQQCFFLQHDPRKLLLPQDWSLGVELKGSALIPLFLFLVRRSTSALLGIMIVLLLFHHNGQYYASFGLGVCGAKYFHRLESNLRSLSLRFKIGILAAGILLYESRLAASYFIPQLNEPSEKIVWCLASVGCVLIMGASLGSNRIQARLNRPAMLLFGKISYSVYLLQFIVILCLLPPLIAVLNAAGIRQWAFLFLFAIGFGVLGTIALALVLYYSVEAPSLELGRWLTKSIQRSRTKTPLQSPGFHRGVSVPTSPADEPQSGRLPHQQNIAPAPHSGPD